MAVQCECVTLAIQARSLSRTELPSRFDHATLSSFLPAGRGRSIQAAHRTAIAYAREWLPHTPNSGLILHGPVGVGKTHLAVGILRDLVLTKGARCLFVDFRDLLKRVQASYSDPLTSEARILAPVFQADVVVLDELGAMRSTDWVADTIERILGERYNRDLSTIITTNYRMSGPAQLHQVDGGPISYSRAAVQVTREETIGDRVGARMFSRLNQMCRSVAVDGTDYRLQQSQAVAL